MIFEEFELGIYCLI